MPRGGRPSGRDDEQVRPRSRQIARPTRPAHVRGWPGARDGPGICSAIATAYWLQNLRRAPGDRAANGAYARLVRHTDDMIENVSARRAATDRRAPRRAGRSTPCSAVMAGAGLDLALRLHRDLLRRQSSRLVTVDEGPRSHALDRAPAGTGGSGCTAPLRTSAAKFSASATSTPPPRRRPARSNKPHGTTARAPTNTRRAWPSRGATARAPANTAWPTPAP